MKFDLAAGFRSWVKLTCLLIAIGVFVVVAGAAAIVWRALNLPTRMMKWARR